MGLLEFLSGEGFLERHEDTAAKCGASCGALGVYVGFPSESETGNKLEIMNATLGEDGLRQPLVVKGNKASSVRVFCGSKATTTVPAVSPFTNGSIRFVILAC